MLQINALNRDATDYIELIVAVVVIVGMESKGLEESRGYKLRMSPLRTW